MCNAGLGATRASQPAERRDEALGELHHADSQPRGRVLAELPARMRTDQARRAHGVGRSLPKRVIQSLNRLATCAITIIRQNRRLSCAPARAICIAMLS